MANKYIDRIKYSDTYFLQDSGATHDSSHNLSGTTGDFSAASITADSGIFKFLKVEDELVANKATVVGLLDVKGELHTNKWTSTNIANIGGSFYISPTYKSSSANLQFGGTANSRSITVSNGTFGSDSASGLAITAWTTGSKVMMTGSVTYNNTTYPLGTCDGTLSGAMDASGFTINGVSSDAVETLYEIIGTNQVTAADIEISMRVIGGTNPVGILLTSFGVSQSTYIDIYGGTNANVGTPTVPNAEPNLRIGYLGDGTNNYGLQKLGGDSEYPKSWGIYTTNGYFKGRIVADSGKIGGINGWSIATDVLYSGSHSTYNADNDGIFLGKSTETGNPYYVAGGPRDGSTTNPLWYLKSDGSAKIGAMTLSNSGVLSVPAANVSGALTAATISADKITTGTIDTNILTANNITTGTITMGTVNTDSYVYISKTGSTLTINSESKSWYLVLGKSFGVTNAGYLSAASGKIGGWTISADRLSTGTIGSSAGIMISPSNTTSYNINGAPRANLRLAIGTNFGVDKDGNLYANGANITDINGSNITANTLSVNAFPSTTQQQILNAGRNLVWDSEWKDIPNRWSDWGSPTTREIVTINGKRWLHLVTTTTAFQGYEQNEDKRNGDNEIQAGEKITVSYYAYAATAGQQATVGVHWRDSSNTIVGQNWATNAVTTTATRYTATYTVPSTAVSFNVMVGDNTSSAQQLWISQVKLEKGESVTEWAAAPEDIPTGYITQINNGGIKVHDINDETDYVAIQGNGISIYNNSKAIADFQSNGIMLYDDTGESLASFGIDGTTIGSNTGGSNYVNLTPNGVTFFDSRKGSMFIINSESGNLNITKTKTLSYPTHHIMANYSSSITKNVSASVSNIQEVIPKTFKFGLVAYPISQASSLSLNIVPVSNCTGSIISANANSVFLITITPNSTSNVSSTYSYSFRIKNGTNTLLRATITIYGYNHSSAGKVSIVWSEISKADTGVQEWTIQGATSGIGNLAQIVYTTTEPAPSYTIGSRVLDSTEGGYSTIVGYDLIAAGNYQTVIGRYNDNSIDNIFEIGNGTSSSALSNAMTVNWNGNLWTAGAITATGNINTNGNFTRNGNSYIVTEEHSVDNKSIAASGITNVDVTMTKTGYTLLGTVSIGMANATSSGAGVGYCTIRNFDMSGNTVTVAVFNTRSSANKIKVIVRGLYRAD